MIASESIDDAIGHRAQAIIDANAIPEFIALLSSPALTLQDQAIRMLGSVVGVSAKCRDYVLRAGALQPLLGFISKESNPYHEVHEQIPYSEVEEHVPYSVVQEPIPYYQDRPATWALFRFCQSDHHPRPDWELVRLFFFFFCVRWPNEGAHAVFLDLTSPSCIE